MSTPNFRFRQFTVWHDRCAMKVGTDGVLVGSWTALPSCGNVRVLDVGVGSGLIALMIAQRLRAAGQDFHITGIDIDGAAVGQARENFMLSPWSDCLEALEVSLQEYEPGERFDLIVTNPPFFEDSLRCLDAQRSTARHTDSLPYESLVTHVSRLLRDDGVFSLIVPSSMESRLVALCACEGLSPVRVTRFSSTSRKLPRRVLLSCKRCCFAEVPMYDTMTMEDAAYQRMVADFYLG